MSGNWRDGEPKYQRGHAYVRVRNRGYSVDIDFPEVDSPCAERMIKAVMEILKADEEQAAKKRK